MPRLVRTVRRTCRAAAPLLAGGLLLCPLAAAPLHATLPPPVALAAADADATAATIRGRVTARGTNAPLAGVQVVVQGTRFGAMTNASGEYAIANVPAGTVTLRALRIGLQPATQTVVVPDTGEVRVDFALAEVATQLEAVVTTATGQMQRREVGNVIASVNADSIVARAPVTNVNELLQARTSGVQVIQGTGQTGASSSIRIRGASSLSLTNEPLVVVDGIRYDNSSIDANYSTARVNALTSLNPEEIESIDVIKGPSAAALYGTAAANGVIVVTTKRGRAGPARWTAYAEYGRVSNDADWAQNYSAWGRNRNPTTGELATATTACRTYQYAANQCVIDSVTTYNPWTAPETDPFESQPRYMLGLQLSGGSERLSYFVAAERENEVGPYTMPTSEIQRITQERGTGPTERQINPNELTAHNFRANLRAGIGDNLTLDVTSGYSDRQLYSAFEGTFFGGMTFQFMTGPGQKNAVNGLQREFVGDIFAIENSLRSRRLTGSVAANWTPLEWLTARGTVGIDQANHFGYRLQRRGEGTRVGQVWGPTAQEGGRDFTRNDVTRLTVDFGATATWDATPTLSTRSSLGLQWFNDRSTRGDGRGYGLPPGAYGPNAARQREAWEFTSENATYGAFFEEQLGWREVLYLTLGVRTDQNSAFGRSVGNTVYPRAALSYVISEESWFPQPGWLDRVRVRGAFGRAGVQPGTTAALQYLGARAYPAGSAADEPGLRVAALGNENLKPEVTTEIEGGIDVGLLGERLNVEFTAFHKRSEDALYERPLAPSFGTSEGTGAPTQWVNLAAVENSGLELALDAQVIRDGPVTLGFRLNGSRLHNELVEVGNVQLPTAAGARNAVGYPLQGLWDRPILGWEDADNNGILSAAEVQLGTAQAFAGSTLPLWEAGLSTTLGLFRDRVQVTALFDYRGDFQKEWRAEEWRCNSTGNCRAVSDTTAPLADQAAAIAATQGSRWGYFVPADFIKFRELSVSYNVPEAFLGRLGNAQSMTLVLSGRNLGYPWTRYPGVDPESNDVSSNLASGNRELTAQPPLRYWLARVNVTF